MTDMMTFSKNQIRRTQSGDSFFVYAALEDLNIVNRIIKINDTATVLIPQEDVHECKNGHYGTYYEVTMSRDEYSVGLRNTQNFEMIKCNRVDVIKGIISFIRQRSYIISVENGEFVSSKASGITSFKYYLPFSLSQSVMLPYCFVSVPNQQVIYKGDEGKSWIRLGFKQKEGYKTEKIRISVKKGGPWEYLSMSVDQFFEETEKNRNENTLTLKGDYN